MMITLKVSELDELLTQLTEAVSICQCAEDAAAVAEVSCVKTALSVSNGILNAAVESLRMWRKAEGGETE